MEKKIDVQNDVMKENGKDEEDRTNEIKLFDKKDNLEEEHWKRK